MSKAVLAQKIIFIYKQEFEMVVHSSDRLLKALRTTKIPGGRRTKSGKHHNCHSTANVLEVIPLCYAE